MMMDDYDGQMMFGDLVGLKVPDIRLTGEEKPRKNLTQETCPDRGSNPGPLRDKRACCRLFHSGGRHICYYAAFEQVWEWAIQKLAPGHQFIFIRILKTSLGIPGNTVTPFHYGRLILRCFEDVSVTCFCPSY